MKCLIYKRPDGGMSIVHPNKRLVDAGKTMDQFKKRSEEADPALKTYTFIGEEEVDFLPKDREFRNQWRHNGSKVEVDPVLETEERWKRIRKERDKALVDSDGLYLRSKEKGIKEKEWETYRQELRDLTKQTDPKTIVWPEKP